jgi:multidrug resistance efflux pump
MRRLPFRWLLQPLANIKDSLRGKRGAIAAAIAGGVAFLVFLLIVIPYPLRMEAKGKLMPKERQTVFSLVTGKITSLKVVSGQPVNKDDELLTINDFEKQQRLSELRGKIDQASELIRFYKEQINKSKSDAELQEAQLSLTKQEFERTTAQAAYDILIGLMRNPQEGSVRAPIRGVVVNFDIHDKLNGAMVKPGDPLLQIAQMDGQWEIELRIPEGHVGHIREAIRQANGEPLGVDIMLTAYHDHTKKFHGWLSREGLSGKVEMENNEPVLNARVQVDDELKEVLKTWQGGNIPVGAEVRAKVRCGNRAIGYVWFYELWEFVFERVLF